MSDSANETKKHRKLDIVMCIDGTGSMSPYLATVKKNAERFYQNLAAEMLTNNNTEIDMLRIKIIVFRDYANEGADAVSQTRFFELNTDMDRVEFEKALADIKAQGGGDKPENGLEALYYAMTSDFVTGRDDRQIIILFTDADALELKERAGCDGYPADMVDHDGLINLWACASQDASIKLSERIRRMIVYAPEGTKYDDLSKVMERMIFVPTRPEDGLSEIDFSAVIKIIAASASSK